MASLTAPIDAFMRAALLGAADNRALRRFMYRHGMGLGARRFVAGETLDEFLAVVRRVNERGFSVACGLLGEDVQDRSATASAVHEYRRILTSCASEGLQSNIALKLTQLGLAIDHPLARSNLTAIVEHARSFANFVRIDMEQSAYTDATLATYRSLRDAGFPNVGTVLQAYLRRSEDDLQSLLPLRPNLRLVKGAYLEPSSIAFTRKSDVDRNYMQLIETSLLQGGFTAIATHDHTIIEQALHFIKRHAIVDDRFEFQMLYGVRPKLQAELMKRGYKVRLAIPFGSQWYPYLMRRLAERPANLWFFLGTLWRK
ncbi:MAG: proline dehydrogenase family protein [Candidatus Eremiobacteraeota bacterium]|nr:proline dehydrogenase family protein [Candidatus Eremiobacteraeota bacterium]